MTTPPSVRPQIILTIGPASVEPDVLRGLARVATRFRLNTSHLSGEALAHRLHGLDDLYNTTGNVIPTVLDLQGAKVRLGTFPAVDRLPDRVELRLTDASADPAVLPVPFASVFTQTRPGDRLHLNDRKVILQITGQPAPDRLAADCVQNGPLGAGKGLNAPDRAYELARITPRDAAAIEAGNRFPWVEYAVSFLLDGREAALYRPLTAGRRLIAKLERPAALAALPAIDEAFDECWLCRGDLGAEAGLERLGPLQAAFVRAFPSLRHPKILAGEVLGSMVSAPIPSRSEIVHLYDSLQAGFDGFVLSDETAIGRHVPAVIDFLAAFFPWQEKMVPGANF